MDAKRIVLAARPTGLPTAENFRTEDLSLPELRDGQVLLETVYISVDPYMRGRMNAGKSYIEPFPVGGVIEGGVIARVIESKSPDLAAGDMVLAGYGWQTHQVVDGARLRKINTSVAPVTTALGVLGMTGLTAYFGLLDIGRPQPGETVVVSGAGGAVGTVTGQIAKIVGARAVGIAGSQEKCKHLKEQLGFDEAINYRDSNFTQQLDKACPDGVDVYFDNVGGAVSDAVLLRIRRGARIVVCGQIALYNTAETRVGVPIPGLLLTKSAVMQGFTVGNYAGRFAQGYEVLANWVREGKVRYEETIVQGFDQVIDAFLQLFSGGNVGKLLVKVAEAEQR